MLKRNRTSVVIIIKDISLEKIGRFILNNFRTIIQTMFADSGLSKMIENN